MTFKEFIAKRRVTDDAEGDFVSDALFECGRPPRK